MLHYALYCIGATFQFCLILMTMFWLFHLFHIFLKVVFPVKSRFLMTGRWKRGSHIVEVLISFFISALGPAIVWLTGIKYAFAFFPPLLCLPTSGVFLFYAMCVPLILILTLGLNMIVTIVWTLFKVSSYALIIYQYNEWFSTRGCDYHRFCTLSCDCSQTWSTALHPWLLLNA